MSTRMLTRLLAFLLAVGLATPLFAATLATPSARKGTSLGHGGSQGDYNAGLVSGAGSATDLYTILPNDPLVTGGAQPSAGGEDGVLIDIALDSALGAGQAVECRWQSSAIPLQNDCALGDSSCLAWGPHPQLTGGGINLRNQQAISSGAAGIGSTLAPDEADTALADTLECRIDTGLWTGHSVTLRMGFVGIRNQTAQAGAGSVNADIFVYCSNGATENCINPADVALPDRGIQGVNLYFHYNPAIFDGGLAAGGITPAVTGRVDIATAYLQPAPGTVASPIGEDCTPDNALFGCSQIASGVGRLQGWAIPCNGTVMLYAGSCTLNYTSVANRTATAIDPVTLSTDLLEYVVGPYANPIRGMDAATYAPLPSSNVSGEILFTSSVCGNGTVEVGELCDDGAANGTTECGCRSDCRYGALGAVCGDQGVECLLNDYCDGFGACADAGAESDGTFCGAPGSGECDQPDICQSGLCDANPMPDGTSCGDPTSNECDLPDQCLTGTCDANLPIAGASCGDQGVECLADDACNGLGGCIDNSYLPDGTACGDPSSDECDLADQCSAGLCGSNPQLLGSPCGSQGVECQVDDFCDGAGICLDQGNQSDGTTCGDPSSSECDGADSCSNGGCSSNYIAVGSPCGDQGVVCHIDDQCDGIGLCSDSGFISNGTACGNPSATECDFADQCQTGSCEANFASVGAACGDQGVECFVDDTCDGIGSCANNGLEPNGNACGDPTITECDLADSCSVGVCSSNYLIGGAPCGDQGVDCRVNDFCDGVGFCLDNGVAPDGTACVDEGNDCTGDLCTGGTCKHPNLQAGSLCGSAANTDCDDPDTCNGAGNCLNNQVQDGSICSDCPIGIGSCGFCATGLCPNAVCGNGTLEQAETCDDGNASPCDGCASDCSRLDNLCGDGNSECAEACDDGTNDGGEGQCLPGCGGLQSCGDGIATGDEVCDNGMNDGSCASCLGCVGYGPANVCGDGNLCGNEKCDDGNASPCDGCSADCSRLDNVCGDNFFECSEFCDDGNTEPCDGCATDCISAGNLCGDNATACGEDCDDGNAIGGDGCGMLCYNEICGNSVIGYSDPHGTGYVYELCDDGNTTSGDGCTDDCRIEPEVRITTVPSSGVDVFVDGTGSYSGRYLGTTSGGELVIPNMSPGLRRFEFRRYGQAPLVVWDILVEAVEFISGTLYSGVPENFTAVLEVTVASVPVDVGDEAAVHLADWDCDGTNDLIVGRLAGDVLFFANDRFDGVNLSPPVIINYEDVGPQPVNVVARSHPFVVDYDNDGYYDLLVGGDDGRVAYYAGSTGCPPMLAPPTYLQLGGGDLDVGDEASLFISDVNLDHKKDLIVGNRLGEIRYFLNTGSDASPIWTDLGILVPAYGFPVHPLMMDVNFDLLPDLSVNNDNETFDVFQAYLLTGNLPTLADVALLMQLNVESTQLSPLLGSGISGAYADVFFDINLGRDLFIGKADGTIHYMQNTHIEGEIDSDRYVNGRDLIRMNLSLGRSSGQPGFDPGSDLPNFSAKLAADVDGIVDLNDRNKLEKEFGTDYTLPFCGNRRVDPGEECDTGGVCSDNAAQKCDFDLSRCIDPLTATCDNVQGIWGRCSDAPGIPCKLNVNACDIPATAACLLVASDGCADTCNFECGDGIIDAGEDCDDSGSAAGDGCDEQCRDEVCGNGVLGYMEDPATPGKYIGEQCDDGNTLPDDACGPTCLAEYCGDGLVQTGEICDDGNIANCDGCRADCTRKDNICGDGIIECGEVCDDSNAVDCDGCNGACSTISPTCGDTVIECAETCDDGGIDPGDGCGATCLIEECGDGVQQVGEACDDGNADAGDGCSADCLSDETCGNGIVDSAVGEQCDDGGLNGTTECGCGLLCKYVLQGVDCGGAIAQPTCDHDTCSGSGTCQDIPNAPTGTDCQTDPGAGPGDLCFGGLCQRIIYAAPNVRKGTSAGLSGPDGDYNFLLTGGTASPNEIYTILPNDPDVTGGSQPNAGGTDMIVVDVALSKALVDGETVVCEWKYSGGPLSNDCGAGDTACLAWSPHPQLTGGGLETRFQQAITPGYPGIGTAVAPDEADTALADTIQCQTFIGGSGGPWTGQSITIRLGHLGARDVVAPAGAGTVNVDFFAYCSNGASEQCVNPALVGGPPDRGIQATNFYFHYNPTIFTGGVVGEIQPDAGGRVDSATAYLQPAPMTPTVPNNTLLCTPDNTLFACSETAPGVGRLHGWAIPCNGSILLYAGSCALGYGAAATGLSSAITPVVVSGDLLEYVVGPFAYPIRGIDGINSVALPSSNVEGTVIFQ